ncbi:MAG: flagellar biosynthetic protein FliR [Gammaproteobacteria bacterium]|jgi:flagellar biosynthetic protein FliR
MFSITDAEVLSLIGAWTWPFLRVGGLVMTAPVIGTRMVPGRVRIAYTLALCGVLVPLLPAPPEVVMLSPQGFLIAIQQVLIGAAIGLVVRIVFVVVEIAGQIVAQQMGLGFASLVDPQTGLQVPVLSQFYIVLATLMFFSLQGHLVLISTLVDSFTILPIGSGGIEREGLEVVLEWSKSLFSGALAIALPIVIALLVVNLAFGVMARSAPQLNVFAIGFPIMILFGVFMIFLTLDTLELHLRENLDAAFSVARGLLGKA